MTRANADLRTEARAACVPLWRIGEFLGISEPTMTRRLRNELPTDEKIKIRGIIKLLAAAQTEEGAQP